ncbi:unnamed protein product, partial [Rotaria magnacalcarata]
STGWPWGHLGGSLLVDICRIHLEKKLVEQLEQYGIVHWRRYVNDILAIFKKDADVDKL